MAAPITTLASATASVSTGLNSVDHLNISTFFPFNESNAVINLYSPVFYLAPAATSTITQTETHVYTVYNLSEHALTIPPPSTRTITHTQIVNVNQACDTLAQVTTNNKESTTATSANSSAVDITPHATPTPNSYHYPFPYGYGSGSGFSGGPMERIQCNSTPRPTWTLFAASSFAIMMYTIVILQLARLHFLLGGWMKVLGRCIEIGLIHFAYWFPRILRGLVVLLRYLVLGLIILIMRILALCERVRLMHRGRPAIISLFAHGIFGRMSPLSLWQLVSRWARRGRWRRLKKLSWANDAGVTADDGG